jgi:hypothetical protein
VRSQQKHIAGELDLIVKAHHRLVCAACHTQAACTKELLTCGKCGSVSYCNKECQKKHWKQHKAVCQAAEPPGHGAAA